MTSPTEAEPDVAQTVAALTGRLAAVAELPLPQALEVFTEVQAELQAALTDLNRT